MASCCFNYGAVAVYVYLLPVAVCTENSYFTPDAKTFPDKPVADTRRTDESPGCNVVAGLVVLYVRAISFTLTSFTVRAPVPVSFTLISMYVLSVAHV